MTSIIPQKQCTKCHQVLPATPEYFWIDNHLKDGFMSSCKQCNRKREALPEGYKRCPKCRVVYELNATNFSHNVSKKRFNSWCKSCYNRSGKDKRRQNRDDLGIVVLPDGFRKCGTCEQIYPSTREYFSTNKLGKDGLQSFCKPCGAIAQREYRKNNPVAVQQTDKKRNQKPERRQSQNARNRENRKNDPLRFEKRKRENARRRALLNQADGSFSIEDVQLQHKTQKDKCWWCGVNLNGKYTIDHRIPLSRGGSNWPENIVIACAFCNYSKNDRMPWEWSDRLL